jgi:hypothetical protein
MPIAPAHRQGAGGYSSGTLMGRRAPIAAPGERSRRAMITGCGGKNHSIVSFRKSCLSVGRSRCCVSAREIAWQGPLFRSPLIQATCTRFAMTGRFSGSSIMVGNLWRQSLKMSRGPLDLIPATMNSQGAKANASRRDVVAAHTDTRRSELRKGECGLLWIIIVGNRSKAPL